MDTINPLLIQMKAQVDIWEAKGDQRYIFLRCYSMMTGNMMSGIAEGRFQDAIWVDRLLHRFAEYYFDALRMYETGDSHAPLVWKQVHDASREQSLHVLQHLLLGINAHINYDLVLAIYDEMISDWSLLPEVKQQVRMADHNLVNKIIGETIDHVQDIVIEREAPFMKVVDTILGRVDEWLLSELIENWRADVWDESCKMLASTSNEIKEAHRNMLEEKVIAKATQMLKY